MYKKNRIINPITTSAIIIILIATIILTFSNNSLAYQYNLEEPTLFYKENEEELKHDIKEYLTPIDDFLIPNSNFEISNTLKENSI